MSALTVLADLRTELTTALEPLDINTYAYLSGRAALPSAMVLAGSPYIESGEAFGEHLVRFEVWISAQKGDNDSETDQVDQLIEAAMKALQTDGWVVEAVSQPFDFQINNGSAFTTSITVTCTVANKLGA